MKKRKMSPDETRKRLIDAGLHLFGVKGFEATRTRELATMAHVNQAAIPYHFGGKEGLYLAVAEYLVERAKSDLGPQVTIIWRMVESGSMTQETTAKMLIRLFHTFMDRVVMSADVNDRSRFIMREYSTPGAGFDIIYNGFLEQMHKLMCRLVGQVIGEDPTTESVIIRTHALFGVVINIVLTRPVLLKRLSWEEYTLENMHEIKKIITEIIVNSLQLGDPIKYMEAL